MSVCEVCFIFKRCCLPFPNALMQAADGFLHVFLSSLLMFSSIPPTQVTSISQNIPSTHHVCVGARACELVSSSHGLIEMTFLLSKLNYSAPLFIGSPVPLFPVHQLTLFLSGPNTCAHKSTDPKNRETITCVFIWGLCEVDESGVTFSESRGVMAQVLLEGIFQLCPDVESICQPLFTTILSIIKVQNHRHRRTLRWSTSF